MKLKIKLSIALVMSLMLVACGGSGGGGVKTTKVYRMIEITEDSEKEEVNHYDENGVLEKKEYFMSDGSSSDFHLYSYDENGVLQAREYYLRGDRFNTFTYDEYGNLITISYESGSPDINIINTYDDLGRLETREENNKVGKYVAQFTYEGNTITRKNTKPTGEVSSVERTYNEYGDLIHYYSSLNNNTYSNKFTYKYDKNKNLIKKTMDRLQDDGSYRAHRVYEYTWKAFTVPESYLCKRNPKSLEAKGCALYSSEVLAKK